MTPESILEFEAACQKTLAEMKESRSTFPDNSWTDGFFQGANSYHSHLLGVLATLRDSKEVKANVPLTEKRIDVIIASEFAPDDPFQLRGSSKEGVAQHGAERLKRELVRLGFVSPDDTAERKEG